MAEREGFELPMRVPRTPYPTGYDTSTPNLIRRGGRSLAVVALVRRFLARSWRKTREGQSSSERFTEAMLLICSLAPMATASALFYDDYSRCYD
jgi:hypothetical protein